MGEGGGVNSPKATVDNNDDPKPMSAISLKLGSLIHDDVLGIHPTSLANQVNEKGF